MDLSFRLKPHLDLLPLLVLTGFCVGFSLWAVRQKSPLLSMKVEDRIGTAVCAKGSCWIRRSGFANIQPIQVGEAPLPVSEEDEVISVGQGSELIVKFDADASELRLLDTSISHVKQGRKSVQIGASGNDDIKTSASPSAAPTASSATDATLIYVGDLPIELTSPATQSRIIAEKFPVRIRFAFSLSAADASEEKIQLLSSWQLRKQGPDGKLLDKIEGQIELQSSRVDAGTKTPRVAFFGDVFLPEAGIFALTPSAMPASAGSSDFVKIEALKGDAALRNEIKSLIQNIDSSPESGLEIRTD